MNPNTVLGLDIGGANLKAATAAGRAVSVPFALWKQPDALPAALAELVGQFPGIDELAVTMTGELCDCYATKREGVNRILDAVAFAAGALSGNILGGTFLGGTGVPPVGPTGNERPHSSGNDRRDAGPTHEGSANQTEAYSAVQDDRRDADPTRKSPIRIRVWSTAGKWLSINEARDNPEAVAASNWHVLATFAGRFAPTRASLLIDIGTTTTDCIPLRFGEPRTIGRTDHDRLQTGELVYVGVRRTPIMALGLPNLCAEYFADVRDALIVSGDTPEEPSATDTADNRSRTRRDCLARLARMLGGDLDSLAEAPIIAFAEQCRQALIERIAAAVWKAPLPEWILLSGVGEWLAQEIVQPIHPQARIVSLTEQLGPDVSAGAPAYAVAVLASERRP